MVDTTTSTTTDLIFEDPPATTRGRPAGESPTGQWLASLREHPGQWAKFPTPILSNGVAQNIKKGKGYGAKPGEFEATVRSATNKRFDLYARYVGGGDS